MFRRSWGGGNPTVYIYIIIIIIIWRMFDEYDLRGISEYKIHTHMGNSRTLVEETVSSRPPNQTPSAYVNEIPILLLLFFFSFTANKTNRTWYSPLSQTAIHRRALITWFFTDVERGGGSGGIIYTPHHHPV